MTQLSTTSQALERGRTAGRSIGMAVVRPATLVPVAVGSVALLVYVRTLLPGIAFADWGEMQTVPHVLGVAHPTGYPTYVILSWVAQLVPLGSVAFRANLLSAVLVSGALATTAAILLRLGVRPVLAAAAALALGAIPTIWAAATVAEVNPLHLLFVALLLHRALVWEERRQTRDLVIGGLLLGLSLGNHLLTVFVAPFFALFVLWVGRREIADRPWILPPAVAAGLLGLSVYLYIPLAAGSDSPLRYNHPVTLDAILWLVGGTQFRAQFGFLSEGGVAEFVGSLGALWRLLADRATPLLPVVGGLGLVLLVARRPAFGLMCVGILVFNAYVWSTYLRLEHYLLVPWLVLAIGFGVALESAARRLQRRHGAIARIRRRPPRRRRRPGLCRRARPGELGGGGSQRRPERRRLSSTRCSRRSRRTRPSCPSGTRQRRCGTRDTCLVDGPMC